MPRRRHPPVPRPAHRPPDRRPSCACPGGALCTSTRSAQRAIALYPHAGAGAPSESGPAGVNAELSAAQASGGTSAEHPHGRTQMRKQASGRASSASKSRPASPEGAPRRRRPFAGHEHPPQGSTAQHRRHLAPFCGTPAHLGVTQRRSEVAGCCSLWPGRSSGMDAAPDVWMTAAGDFPLGGRFVGGVIVERLSSRRAAIVSAARRWRARRTPGAPRGRSVARAQAGHRAHAGSGKQPGSDRAPRLLHVLTAEQDPGALRVPPP
jgi:hypothetical protein